MLREHPSPLIELEVANRRALFGGYDRTRPLHEKASAAPYFGYVEIRVGNAPPFLMFTNGDDVVAQHFLYDERPGFEAASLRLWATLAQQAGRVFDVGAFSGIFSLTARAVNPNAMVWAFEPSRNTFNRLVTNIWVNRFSGQVAPLMLALGDKVERSVVRHPFGVYVLGSGESLLDTVVENAWYTEEIDVVPGDSLEALRAENPRRFIIDRPMDGVDLMKIDVEGFEPRVLDGLATMIDAHKPTMLIECLNEAQLDAVQTRLPRHARVCYVDDRQVCIHSDRERFLAGDERNILVVLRPELDIEAVCATSGVFSELRGQGGTR